ncbi:MAG: DUF711 family protein [Chloroflexota bacterium]|nr:DUF711 family protein [Dehalococcoidia bacterium]MDW8254455.1 DUF711 family protein [Chloroflexota bacterium]
MRLRAITLGISITPQTLETTVAKSAAFLARSAAAFRAGGFEVDTLRLTTQPVDEALDDPGALVELARRLEAAALAAGVDYAALGPARLASPAAPLAWGDALADALLATERLFGSVQIGHAEGGVSVVAARACARAIQRLARATDHGMGNLRFAVQACTPPGGPFFPTGYHDGGSPQFALALEAADLAVAAFSAGTLAACRDRLVATLEAVGGRLAAIAHALIREEEEVRFAGIDLTLAPFPTPDRSIVAALEQLGVRFGGPGTLAAVAFLADTLRRVDLPRCGFSGVMLPLLEDSVLAERHAEGTITLDTLLLMSAVCGAGLDTIPLPGETTEAQLTGILLDVAALAVLLEKPLTARLLPVPGLGPGERTRFTFPYFANSTTARLAADGPAGTLAETPTLDLRRQVRGDRRSEVDESGVAR